MNDRDALKRRLEKLPMEPENGALYNDIGAMLYGLADFANARDYLECALELSPADPTVLFNYAQALYACLDWAKAAEILKKFLRMQPQDKDALGLLADACYQMGEYGSAESYHIRKSSLEEGK